MRSKRWRFYETASGAKPVQAFRVLFSPEGRAQQVLLALGAFTKKTQKTPARTIELAERRLSDWRSRGRPANR